MKTTHIATLSQELQQRIRKDLENELEQLGFDPNCEESSDIIQQGMDGRLCDLEELLDITSYLA